MATLPVPATRITASVMLGCLCRIMKVRNSTSLVTVSAEVGTLNIFASAGVNFSIAPGRSIPAIPTFTMRKRGLITDTLLSRPLVMNRYWGCFGKDAVSLLRAVCVASEMISRAVSSPTEVLNHGQ